MICGVLIDLDGTVYVGDRCLPGTPQAIKRLRDLGMRILFVTNNSTRPPETLAEKLRGMDIPCTEGEVLTSSMAVARHLEPGRVLWIGMDGLRVALRGCGFELFDLEDLEPGQEQILDYVVVGLDRQLTQPKAEIAARCIRAGAQFVATNRDRKVNTNRGFVTGAAKTVGAVADLAGTEPRVVGKPEQPIFDQAIVALGMEPHKIAMVGDNLLTDVLGGRQAGLRTVLVLSGVTSRLDLESEEARDPDGNRVEPDEIYGDLSHWVDQLTEQDPESAPPARYRLDT